MTYFLTVYKGQKSPSAGLCFCRRAEEGLLIYPPHPAGLTQLENLKTKMKITPVLLLVLLPFGLPARCDSKEEPVLQAAAPAQAPRSRFAALDDVRLLANGLLQLGQSLREFVQKTKGQINDIFQKLNIFDRSFYQLSVLTSEIKEEEEELKKTTVVLKASNAEIKDLSVQINSRVDSILQEKSNLQNKLEGLEEKLSSMSKGLLSRHQAAEINRLRVRLCFTAGINHTQRFKMRDIHSISKVLRCGSHPGGDPLPGQQH